MSIQVMTWAWKESRAEGPALLVLLAIADASHDDGRGAWPSVATLAAKARVNERTVQRCIHRLVTLGELEVEPCAGRNGVNVYRVIMDKNARQRVTPTESHPVPETPGRESGGVTDVAQGGDTCVTRTVIEPKSSLVVKSDSYVPANSPSVAHAKNRARRLDRNWVPDPVDHRKQHFTDAEALTVLEEFRDYWCARGDSRAAKLDWQATWRNWLRNQNHRRRVNGKHGPNGSTTDARVAEGLALAERLRLQEAQAAKITREAVTA